MESYIIMCRSLTYAQRAERLLTRSNIGAGLVKAPQGVTPEGCSYGLRVSARNRAKALVIMKSAGIATGKVYRMDSAGNAAEVRE